MHDTTSRTNAKLIRLYVGAIQNAAQLLDQQHGMEAKIFRIWQVLSAFEGNKRSTTLSDALTLIRFARQYYRILGDVYI
jgi:hypothetical protein